MTIIFNHGFACVNSNTPWTLSSERDEETQDLDLVLHISNCRPIRVLRGEEIRQTYPNANNLKIAEAYSIITSHAWHKFKIGADIDLEELQTAVFEKWDEIPSDSAGPTGSVDPSWSGSLVSFVWIHALQILEEMLGKTALIEWLTHSKIESFSTEQLVLRVVDGLPDSIILEGVIDQLRNILRERFLLDVEIIVSTSESLGSEPGPPLFGNPDPIM